MKIIFICNNVKVFAAMFDQFKASLTNKTLFFVIKYKINKKYLVDAKLTTNKNLAQTSKVISISFSLFLNCFSVSFYVSQLFMLEDKNQTMDFELFEHILVTELPTLYKMNRK